MFGVRERISQILMMYLSAEGYALSTKTKKTHALDSFVCSYINAAGNLDNIKIEINYQLRCHALPLTETNTLSSEVFPTYKIRIISPVEIFASKIVALSSRAAARDLYDLYKMVYYGLFDVEWEDGRKFDTDEVTNVCRAASIKAGGAGIRYTVRIGRALRHLFLEEDKWFIENK